MFVTKNSKCKLQIFGLRLWMNWTDMWLSIIEKKTTKYVFFPYEIIVDVAYHVSLFSRALIRYLEEG